MQRPSLVRSTALLAIAAIAPLVLFAGFSASVFYRQRQDDLKVQAVADARRVSEAVDRELAANIDAAETLAALPHLDGPLDVTGFNQIAAREQHRHPLWLTVILLDPKGNRLVNSGSGKLGPALDIDSALLAARTGRPVVGNIRQGPPEFGIPIRAPAVRNGKVVAVVSIVMRPGGMRDALLTPRLPASWITTVIDGSGKVTARSRSDSTSLGRTASKAALQARAAAQSGVYNGRTIEGIETLSAFWKSPTTGWSVHVGIPKAEFEAPLHRSIWFTVLGSLASLLLASLFVALLLREIGLRRREAAVIEQSGRLEALGRLTGGVAHDFNNLLMVIQGSTEMLERRLKSERAEKPIAAIKDATGRAAKLTRELLVFARGGSAEQAAVDLNTTIENFLDSMVQAVGPGVAVTLDLDPEAGAVMVDRVQLEVALLNLAVNARDAMPEGGRLMVSTRREGKGVALSVADSGVGIPEDVVARIFDPFFTTKAPGAGTGLGLTQVYSFAKHSGGAVAASSKPGKGTTISLKLPGTDVRVADPPPPADQSEGRLSGRRVLLVDDDVQVRSLTAAYLQDQGADVAQAGSAADGLARLDGGGRWDVVVSDIAMPGEMNGLAMAKAVRSKWPKLPIVLVSGYSASIGEAGDFGLPVLWKPYELAELAAAIGKVLAPPTPVDALEGGP